MQQDLFIKCSGLVRTKFNHRFQLGFTKYSTYTCCTKFDLRFCSFSLSAQVSFALNSSIAFGSLSLSALHKKTQVFYSRANGFLTGCCIRYSLSAHNNGCLRAWPFYLPGRKAFDSNTSELLSYSDKQSSCPPPSYINVEQILLIRHLILSSVLCLIL